MKLKEILFRTATLLTLCAAGSTGCDESDPEAFLSLSRTEAEVAYDGLSADNREPIGFELGSNTAWKATHVDAWIHPSHTEGDRGRVRIFLTIDENLTGEDREGFVVFEGAGQRRTFAVVQRLKVEELSVTPRSITVVKSGLLASGEPASVFISANSDWRIDLEEGVDWITPETLSGEPGETAVALKVDQNRTAGNRTGSFTVTAGKLTSKVTVTQNLEGLKVSTAEFTVNRFGFMDDAQTPLTFTVDAAEAWTSEADAWLTLSPASAEAGRTQVTLTVAQNDTGAARQGAIRIVTAMTGMEATIRVDQNNRNTLFEDDGKPVGYLYYSEDFAWTSAFNGTDCVGLHTQNGAVNIYSKVDGEYQISPLFTEAGLRDLNPSLRTMYACAGYFKMGATNKQTGIVFPAPAIAEGRSADVELSFVAASNIGGDGTGTPDAVTVSVEILEGPGGVDDITAKVSAPMTPEADWKWTPMRVKLIGITSETRYVIRSTQQNASGLFRWYLDDVKLVKTAAN